MQKVFLFGTLKEGFPNFEHNDGVRVAGRFRTKLRYPLYLVGQRCSPWLVNQPGEGKYVCGEVYTVNEEGLDRMDVLERTTAADGYRRMAIALLNMESAEQITCFAYFKSEDQLDAAEIQMGPIAEYRHEHAQKYRSRTE